MNRKIESSIVISGMEVITPFGFGLDKFKFALKNSKSAVRNIHTSHPEESQIISVAAFLPQENLIKSYELNHYDEATQKKFVALSARASLTAKYSMSVCLRAYYQANLFKLNKDRIGIIIAGNNTSQNETYQQLKLFQNAPQFVSARHAINFLDSSHIGYISELLDITGEGYTVGAASASGNMAIIQAMRLIECNIIDCCLVVGVMADLSVVELQSLRQSGALGGIKFKDQPDKASRPFDKKHEGFIPGQAAACLVIEKQNTANQRNAPTLGYLRGYGMCLDANHSSNPSLDGEINCMQKAISSAKLKVDDISYINAHGTSSVLGDEIEAKAIATLFKHAWVNSTKSLIGHCLWSAGIIEAIATLIQLNDCFFHANLNLEEPILDDIQFIGANKVHYCKNNNKFSLSNNFAFGGINTSILLQRGDIK